MKRGASAQLTRYRRHRVRSIWCRLADHVEAFGGRTVVVLGDFVADEFQFGEISRVSREAPVLILRHRETQLVPGGGANAANNFAALGARVLPVTVVGQDAAGDALVAYFRERKMDVSGVRACEGAHDADEDAIFGGMGAHGGAAGFARGSRAAGGVAAHGVRAKIAAIAAGEGAACGCDRSIGLWIWSGDAGIGARVDVEAKECRS